MDQSVFDELYYNDKIKDHFTKYPNDKLWYDDYVNKHFLPIDKNLEKIVINLRKIKKEKLIQIFKRRLIDLSEK